VFLHGMDTAGNSSTEPLKNIEERNG